MFELLAQIRNHRKYAGNSDDQSDVSIPTNPTFLKQLEQTKEIGFQFGHSDSPDEIFFTIFPDAVQRGPISADDPLALTFYLGKKALTELRNKIDASILMMDD